MTPAEAYEVRERKQSLVQLSSDPFDNLAGRHRQSVSGVASSASAAATRRRSSAVAPDAVAAASAHHATQHHSGFDGDRLEPIESRAEIPPINVGSTSLTSSGISSSSTSHNPGGTTRNGANGEHAQFHDSTTVGHNHPQPLNYVDPDAVAPDERR